MNEQLFIENYQLQIDFDHQLELLKEYKYNSDVLSMIKKNFVLVWVNTKFMEPTDYTRFLYCLGDCPTMNQVYEKHLNFILNHTKDISINRILQILKESNVNIDENIKFTKIIKDHLKNDEIDSCRELLLNYKFENNNEKYVDLMIERAIEHYYKRGIGMNKKLFCELIKYLIIDLKEINKKQEEKECEVTYCGYGSFSDCFQVGNYVLKIGKKRNYPILKNYRYLIPRVFYKEFYYNNIVIEITPLCNLDNITKRDVIKVYFNSRDDNCLWIDVKKNNLGRLAQDTTDLFPDITALGHRFMGTFPYEPKKKDDLVIIDLDYFIQFDLLTPEEKEILLFFFSKRLTNFRAFVSYEKAYRVQKQKIKNKSLTKEIK